MADFDFTQLKGRMAQAGKGGHVELSDLERNALISSTIEGTEKVISYNDLADKPTDLVESITVRNIVALTQEEYDALTTKDSNTLYVIISD